MSKQARRYQTQWAAQFYVAAELTRRGYLVSLTLGNAPVADLLVVSPEHRHFEVDVKGQSTRNFWLIQRREPEEDLFFVLVYLPKGFGPPSFYVLSSAVVSLLGVGDLPESSRGTQTCPDGISQANFRPVLPRLKAFGKVVWSTTLNRDTTSSAELMKLREEYRQHIEAQSGRYDDKLGGINWSTALDYENRWDRLPA